MSDYKAVRSSLDISKRMAFYLERCDPANYSEKNRAETIRTLNDTLQGRTEQSIYTPVGIVNQICRPHFPNEILEICHDVSAFFTQKRHMLNDTYDIGYDGCHYDYKQYEKPGGRSLKVVDQALFDKAAKRGFPPKFFEETYFDQVTLYCLPKGVDFYGSTFQNCTFAVCRISVPSFVWASIYSSEFHSCVLEHADFFSASIEHTHFHDSVLSHVTFQKARLKSCNTIDCTLNNINYLNAVLDGCSFARVIPSNIHSLTAATITQSGATQEECLQNRDAIFQGLGVEQEVT